MDSQTEIEAAHDPAAAARGLLGRALVICMVAVFLLVLGAARTQGDIIEHRPDIALTMYFAIKQDIPLATLVLLLFVGWRLRGQGGVPSPTFRLGGWQVAGMLGVLALGIWLLRLFVLGNYDMSRDEQMVTFDAAIFARGHLFAPIAEMWRPYYEALNVAFILPIGDREAWVSGYLPGNAALRALLGQVMPATAIGALFVAIAGLALWRVSLRLFPASGSTRAVMLILFATSSQVILTGTTTFAMTAHMAANLVWLALFLQRRPLAHAGAIAVGFIATGLHQPLFHPFFVAPFLLLLLREKAWKELAAYVLCYGAIGLFWLGWQPWLSAQALHPVPPAHSNDGTNYIDRFRATVSPFSQYSFWVMAANLLRFVTWQNLALLPLMAVPLLLPSRRDPLVMALWLGPVMVVVFMTLVLPAQVNGWGYRYVAGFLGSAIVLAGMGWHWLEQRAAAPVRVFAVATALSVLVVLPLHVWMAAGQIGAYADAARAARAFDADIVVVDEGIPFAGDLVLNRADLSNRPILLSRSRLRPADMAPLCAGRTIAFADAPLFGAVSRFFRIPPPATATPRQTHLRAAAEAAGCRIAGWQE